MNNLHNLGTVIRFEVARMLKKPSFWLMALGFPIMMGVIFGIVFMSNQATLDAAENLKDQKFSIIVLDDSGLIQPGVIEAVDAKTVESREDGIGQVKTGKAEAFFYYPKDLSKNKVEVFGKDVGVFENSRYTSVAKLMLDQSVSNEVTADKRAVLQDSVALSSTVYRDGVEYDAIREMILPGIFMVLFYVLIGFFGGQMLNSTIEEKENRTIEMLLTTVEAKTLISGKILSLVALALIQGFVILLPILIMYFVVGPQLQLPNIDLAGLPVDAGKIAVGALVFGFSFILFTGLLVAVGSAMPTAKEASNWFGIIIMMIFGPLYGVTAFVSYPDSPFVQFLSLFPLTSPIPLMLRNAVGNLPVGEAVLGIVILGISSVLVMLVAVRIFQLGAMEYDSKLSLSALRRRRKSL